MIRSNLPLPFLYRLRLRAADAARRATASPVNYRQRPEAGNGRAASRSALRRPAGTDAAQVWLRFVDQYELFMEVLCAAAKDGCDSRKEIEYAQMRCWFMTHYYRVAGRVRADLEAEFGSEGGTPTIADYAGQKRTLDALEALFLPPTLREVLKHDTGDLIPRVARISEVIYRCHAEWEQGQSAERS